MSVFKAGSQNTAINGGCLCFGKIETEELIRKCQAITLEGEEADQFIFEGLMKEKGYRAVAGCLAGKILLAREVNREGLKIALY